MAWLNAHRPLVCEHVNGGGKYCSWTNLDSFYTDQINVNFEGFYRRRNERFANAWVLERDGFGG